MCGKNAALKTFRLNLTRQNILASKEKKQYVQHILAYA